MDNRQSVNKLNSLRAAVLGANDGIVSVAGIILGVAGANHSTSIVFMAGLAGLLAGAFSMATGEYISVSSQRDTQKAMLENKKFELENDPEGNFQELINLYQKKGLSKKTATLVAQELTDQDAYKAHIDIELGIDPDDLNNPISAALASAISFTIGALIPLLAITLSPLNWKIPLTFLAVLITLSITGIISAHIGGAKKTPATLRIILGGIIAISITYLIGSLIGSHLH